MRIVKRLLTALAAGALLGLCLQLLMLAVSPAPTEICVRFGPIGTGLLPESGAAVMVTMRHETELLHLKRPQ